MPEPGEKECERVRCVDAFIHMCVWSDVIVCDC